MVISESLNISQSNSSNLNRLKKYLQTAGSGMAVVTVNSPRLRDRQFALLEKDFSLLNFRIYHLKLEPGAFSFAGQLIKGIETANPAHQAIYLYNLEALLPEEEDQRIEFIKKINFSREKLGLSKIPIIFWLPGFLARLMQRYALDFWDWRGPAFHFEEPEIKPRPAQIESVKDLMAADQPTRENMIKLLEDQYKQLSPEEKEQPRAVKDFLLPLRELYHEAGLYKKTLNICERILALDQKHLEKRHPDIAEDLNDLGAAWNSLGEHRKALEYHRQALEIREEVYGKRHPAVADSLNNLGSAWNHLGEYKKAISYHQQALEIREEVYGKRHPDVARSLNNLGNAWDNLGEYKKAISYHQQALEILEEVYEKKHPDVAQSLNNLGAAWKSLGDYQKAISYFSQAYNMFLEFLGADHPNTEIVKNNLESCKKAAGKSE